jgi:hypothetical protein
MAAMERTSTAAFNLEPFGGAGGPLASAITITGQVARQGRRLELHAALTWRQGRGDDGQAIVWPAAADGPPQRRDGLWQHTCLEVFVAAAELPCYWEFNLAPNGDWAAYRLDGYRQGLRPEPAYSALTVDSSPGPGRFTLALDCLLPPPIKAGQRLLVAVSAVLEHRSGELSYWALHHGGSEPDFHRRDGFLLRL